MPVKVAIDITSYAYAPMSGTGVYVRNVVSRMMALRNDIEFHLISSIPCDVSWADGSDVHFGQGELSKHNIAWWAIAGNRLLSQINADVFWSPFQFFPIGMSKRRRAVLTVLDLVWYHMPTVMERKNYLLNKTMMRQSIKKASNIIVISNATRDDLLDRFDVNGKEVYPIHLAASSEFDVAMESELNETVQRYPACRQPYIFAVGALEPRKNHLRLLMAVEKLRRSECEGYNLIIAGSSGWRNDEFFRYIEDNNHGQWVHILWNVEQRDLKSLYNMAELLVFPSLMEGFGLPILEAMACGCPVVTSNLSSMPEVAGDAAVLVDPYDVDSIAAGITAALQNRGELGISGIGRAGQFSWQKSAQQHLDVFLAGLVDGHNR